MAVPEEGLPLRQIDVQTSWAVALFAAYVDFRKRCVVGVRFQVVVLLQVGGVALGASRVPVLGDASPVERIVWSETFVGNVGRRDFEPFFAMGVPRNAKHLHSAVRELDHILLEWVNAEGVFDLEVLIGAVWPLGIHHILAVTGEEPCSDAEPLEGRIVEVAKHRFGGGDFHRAIVVRAVPQVVLLLVAFHARPPANVSGLFMGVLRISSIPIGSHAASDRESHCA